MKFLFTDQIVWGYYYQHHIKEGDLLSYKHAPKFNKIKHKWNEHPSIISNQETVQQNNILDWNWPDEWWIEHTQKNLQINWSSNQSNGCESEIKYAPLLIYAASSHSTRSISSCCFAWEKRRRRCEVERESEADEEREKFKMQSTPFLFPNKKQPGHGRMRRLLVPLVANLLLARGVCVKGGLRGKRGENGVTSTNTTLSGFLAPSPCKIANYAEMDRIN